MSSQTPPEGPEVPEAPETPEAPFAYHRKLGDWEMYVAHDGGWGVSFSGTELVSRTDVADTKGLIRDLYAVGANDLIDELGQDSFWTQLVWAKATER